MAVSVTSGFTVDYVWQTGSDYTDLTAVEDVSLRITASFSDSDEGILFEAGGSGRGIICYLWAGTLYAQGGTGQVFGTEQQQVEVSWPVPAGAAQQRVIEIAFESATGEGRLFIDGYRVAQDAPAGDISRFSGSDDGGLAVQHGSSIPANRGGFDGSTAAFTGTLDSALEIMVGELPPSDAGTGTPPSQEAVTKDFIVDYVWQQNGVYTDLYLVREVSFRFEATFSAVDSGVLFESGATSYGLIAYIFEGVLYAQAGVGAAFGPGEERMEVSWPIPEGAAASRLVEVAFEVGGEANLWIDGQAVASVRVTGVAQYLAGSNEGSYGRVYSSAAENRGGWSYGNTGAFPGTLETDLEIMEGERPPFAFVPNSYQEALLALSPWGYWPLDTDGQDRSGGANALTIGGTPTYQEGLLDAHWGIALSGGYGTATGSLRVGSWTLMAWTHLTDAQPRQVLFEVSDRNNGLALMVEGGLVKFSAKYDDRAGSTYSTTIDAAITEGEPHMVAATYEERSGAGGGPSDDRLALYLDGEEVASTTWSYEASNENAQGYLIGVGAAGSETFAPDGTPLYTSSGDLPLEGVIDEPALFFSALSAAQIVNLYALGATPTATGAGTIGPATGQGDASARPVAVGAGGTAGPLAGVGAAEAVPIADGVGIIGAARGQGSAGAVPIADGVGIIGAARGQGSADVPIFITPSVSEEATIGAMSGQGFGLSQANRRADGRSVERAFVRSMKDGAEVSFRKGSLSGREQLQACDTFRFAVIVRAGEGLPLAVGEPVRISADERERQILVGGTISRVVVEEPASQKRGGPAGLRIARYEGQCYTSLANRQLVAGVWEGVTAGQVVRDLVARSVAAEGVVTEFEDGRPTVEEGPVLSRVAFNYEQLTDALDTLSERAGLSWYIDAHKRMRFFERASYVAPFGLTPESSPYSDLTIEESREQYRNKQYVRGGQSLTLPRTETFKGDGRQKNFTLRFPAGTQPTIRVGGQVQPVGIGELETGAAWYWNKGKAQVSQADERTPITSEDVLEVTYQGIVPVLVEHTDAAAVAERKAVESGTGVYEDVVTDRSIDRQSVASDTARSLLRRHGKLRRRVSFSTHTAGLKKGHIVRVDLPDMAFTEQVLIDSVAWQVRGDDKIQWRVEALSGEPYGGWQQFFRKLLSSAEGGAAGDTQEQVLLVRSLQDGVTVRTDALLSEAEEQPLGSADTVGVAYEVSLSTSATPLTLGDETLGSAPLGSPLP